MRMDTENRLTLWTKISQWYRQKVVQKGFIGQFLRKCRRFYLGTFNPKYIENTIQSKRQGDCHRCGACCELIYRCPFLGRDSQNLPYCRIYGDLRPVNCRNYPFDEIDSEIDQCGFKFKKGMRNDGSSAGL